MSQGKTIQTTRTVRISSVTIMGDTVAARYAIFRQTIEPELAAQRPQFVEGRHDVMIPRPKGWKTPKDKRPERKRKGYHQHAIIKRKKA